MGPQKTLPCDGAYCTNVNKGCRASWVFKSLSGANINVEISYDDGLSKGIKDSFDKYL